MQIIVSEWEWVLDSFGTGVWHPPAQTVQSLDLRTLPEMASPGPVASGSGLFVLPDGAPLPPGATVLGSDFAAALGSRTRSDWEARLQLPLNAIHGAAVQDSLFSVMTENADPSGVTAMRPKMPRDGKTFDLTLAGQRVEYGGFDRVRDNWVKANLRRDYAEASVVTPATRLLNWMVAKYGYSAAELTAPSGGATVTESFNTGDSTTLGPDQTWAEVIGDMQIFTNRAAQTASGNARHRARCDTGVSTVDHYTEVLEAILSITFSTSGSLVRYASAADTCYQAEKAYDGTNADYAIKKVITGTETSLGTLLNQTWAADRYLRLTIVDDDLEFLEGSASPAATSLITVTNDTSITGGTQGGIVNYANGSNRARIDSYEQGDIGAPPASTVIRRNLMTMGAGR